MLRDDFRSFEVLQQAGFCQAIVDQYFNSNLLINHFSVVLLTDEARVCVASTLPQYYQASVERQLIYYDPIYSPQVNEQLTTYLWDDEIESARLEEIRWLRHYYHLFNSLSVIKRDPGAYRIYSLSTSKPVTILRSLLLNQTDNIIQSGDDIFEKLLPDFVATTALEIPA